MSELFIELYTEEMPARYQQRGAQDFMCLLQEGLKAEGIPSDEGQYYVSPRHIAVIFNDVPLHRANRTEERKGPRIDAPQAAVDGFLKSTGCTLAHCEQRETPKGTFLFAVNTVPGAPLTELLPSIVTKAIHTLSWPQSMRWGHSSKSWIRPLRSGICQLDGQTMAFTVALSNTHRDAVISFADTTIGHRFLHQGQITVKGFADYKQKMIDAHVMIDHVERQKTTKQQIHNLAHAHNLTVVDDPDLFNEVTGLVEWPIALPGRIDPQFMNLPPEVLQTSMRVHQRYFSLNNAQGNMAPYFIVVSNMVTTDHGQQIIIGNERVLRARLSDAQFFYNVDVKTPLLQMAEGLHKITFHAQLGTMADKIQRLQQLARHLAPPFAVDETQAVTAASLLKADLLSKMVGEFPELQGLMGQAYAKAQGLPDAVATAIAEHYLPKSSQDQCPLTSLGQLCAVADRIDTLTGFFSINIKPTGSKDPFALRRAALGLIRLLQDQHNIQLTNSFAVAYDLYQPILAPSTQVLDRTTFLQTVEEFIIERIKVLWKDQGIQHDVISAVLTQGLNIPLYLIKKRAMALQEFLNRDDATGHNLLQAYRRAANILTIEQDKDSCLYDSDPDPLLAIEPAEQNLLCLFNDSQADFDQALQRDDFTNLMDILATFRSVIDDYFQDIIVNSPDPVLRRNRLQTLSKFVTLLHYVADFSKIQDR